MYDKRISHQKNYLKSIPQKGKLLRHLLSEIVICRRKAYKYTQQDVVEHQSESEHTQQNEQQ
ncbi:21974_t:CDS:2, partial [Gigaspora margarita]